MILIWDYYAYEAAGTLVQVSIGRLYILHP